MGRVKLCKTCMPDPYLVFWVKGGSVARIKSTAENIKEANRLMHLSVIAADYTGTIHYNVNAVYRKPKKKEQGHE